MAKKGAPKLTTGEGGQFNTIMMGPWEGGYQWEKPTSR